MVTSANCRRCNGKGVIENPECLAFFEGPGSTVVKIFKFIFCSNVPPAEISCPDCSNNKEDDENDDEKDDEDNTPQQGLDLTTITIAATMTG